MNTLAEFNKKEASSGSKIALSIDCWIAQEVTVHEIWLSKPTDDVIDFFTHYPAGSPIPEFLWNTDAIVNMKIW
ncbi:MAG: hypothetical protein ACXABY_18520 [Candidatus Thorarchaeota archaeon]|jgi:hypothetical protein